MSGTGGVALDTGCIADCIKHLPAKQTHPHPQQWNGRCASHFLVLMTLSVPSSFFVIQRIYTKQGIPQPGGSAGGAGATAEVTTVGKSAHTCAGAHPRPYRVHASWHSPPSKMATEQDTHREAGALPGGMQWDHGGASAYLGIRADA